MSKKKRAYSKAPPKRKPDLGEIAIAAIYDKYSTYPSNGLTPSKLARIFRQADEGDILQQAELFEEMEEKDPHLFSQLQTRKNAVTGLDYEIIPFGEDEYDKEIAEFVSNELQALESLEDCMMDALDAIGKGISVCEIIWEQSNEKVSIQEIKWRHQKCFYWDSFDNFRVITKEHPEGMIVPENKYIIHRYKARSGHPSRAGVLRVVAWMYLFKNYDLKDWVSFCEIFGMPLRLGKYNPSASEDDKRALMDALVRIGTDAAGMIPEGTTIDFKEASKSTSIDVYERLARYCDEQMSKAILGQTLTSDSGGGSFAQSKTHNEVRHDLTVADCKSLAATLRRDLIRPLVFFNFGEEKRIPYIRYDCEEAGDLKETAEMYKSLICDMGLKIPTSHLYKKFSIPKPENGEEIASPATGAPEPILANKEEVLIANKKTEENKGIVDSQKKIDDLVDVCIKKNEGAFQKMFEPILKIIDKCEDMQELQELFQDEKAIQELYSKMEVHSFQELLYKAMLLADIEGRMIEVGKSG